MCVRMCRVYWFFHCAHIARMQRRCVYRVASNGRKQNHLFNALRSKSQVSATTTTALNDWSAIHHYELSPRWEVWGTNESIKAKKQQVNRERVTHLTQLFPQKAHKTNDIIAYFLPLSMNHVFIEFLYLVCITSVYYRTHHPNQQIFTRLMTGD